MDLYENPALFDLTHRGFQGDVAWYRAVVGGTPSLIVDLGCGTGRITLPLAADGHRLVAIDASEDMAEVMRRRITPTHDIRVLVADALQVPLEAQADAVLATCNFLCHFTASDRRKLLHRITHWLAPTGQLALDVVDPQWHRQHPHVHRVVPFRMDDGSAVVIEADSRCSGAEVDVSFLIRTGSMDGQPSPSDAILVQSTTTLHLIEEQTLRSELEGAGFLVQSWTSAFGPSDTDTVGRMVILAKPAIRTALEPSSVPESA
jgi:SAM-dependent methyltransferase